jgi:hypothetical protein
MGSKKVVSTARNYYTPYSRHIARRMQGRMLLHSLYGDPVLVLFI